MSEPTPSAFDSAAATYAALGAYLWTPIGRHLVACSRPQAGDRVLDACCGDGASAVPAADAVGVTGRVDAVDLSPAMVERTRARSRGLPQITVQSGDVVTWPTEGYDVVQCALGVFFFPDLATGTDHLVACARPGGRVAITIWRRDAIEPVVPHLRVAREQVSGEAVAARPPAPIDRINEPEPFATWLTARGLSGVDIQPLPLTLSMTPRIAWLLVTGSGFAGMLHDLDTRQIEQFRTAYLDSLDRAGVTELDATSITGVGTRAF